VPRATFYRHQKPKVETVARPPRLVSRALPPDERKLLLSILNDDRFFALAPAEVYATLLDEEKFVCSIPTMYRILRENQQVRKRRNQLHHPRYKAPELLATGPNQLRSWDITKLKGPAKWTYFSLYVILDVFSGYVVGWMVAYRRSGGSGRATDRVGLQAGRDREGETHDSWQSGVVDDLQAGRAAALRPGGERATAAPTSRTTIRTRRASSRPSSTSRDSPTGSGRFRTPAAS